MKKQNHLSTAFFVVGLIIVGSVLTSLIPSKKQNPKVEQKSNERAILQGILQQYLAPLAVDDWWMIRTPPPDVEAARSLSQSLLNVSNALASARSVSPLTEEIFQNFNTLYTSVYERGVSRVTMEGPISEEYLRGKTEVCFFSKSDYNPATFQGLLFYRSDWKAVLIAGVRWDGPIFGGVLYHELCHALQHRKGVLGTPPSETYFRGELEAHELEIAVIDKLSKGKYGREVTTVLEKYSRVGSPHTLLASIATSDLHRLDVSIGLEKAGHSIRGTSVAQHLLTLGFAFIEKQGGGVPEKIALYRWVRGG